MLYLTVMLYLYEGKEAAFANYEEQVLPLLQRYGGKMLYRTQPALETELPHRQELPYEMHLLSFPSEIAFQDYLQDPDRIALTLLQRSIIRKAVVMQSDGSPPMPPR